jgi:hypothetical protein
MVRSSEERLELWVCGLKHGPALLEMFDLAQLTLCRRLYLHRRSCKIYYSTVQMGHNLFSPYFLIPLAWHKLRGNPEEWKKSSFYAILYRISFDFYRYFIPEMNIF